MHAGPECNVIDHTHNLRCYSQPAGHPHNTGKTLRPNKKQSDNLAAGTIQFPFRMAVSTAAIFLPNWFLGTCRRAFVERGSFGAGGWPEAETLSQRSGVGMGKCNLHIWCRWHGTGSSITLRPDAGHCPYGPNAGCVILLLTSYPSPHRDRLIKIPSM